MPASIQASAISHVAVCVRNMERALQFYRDILGFEITKDDVQDTSHGGLPHLYQTQHAQRRVVHLRYGDRHAVPFLVLTEHPGEAVTGTPIRLDQVGISHLSFTVPNVEALTQRLLAQGVQTCGPADAFRDANGHIRTVFVFDPDGILVQFDEGGEG